MTILITSKKRLDVLVEKSTSKFITSNYHKPTFNCQYLRWNSFSTQKRKTNLILTLTRRALAVCSPERLLSELDKIKLFLQTNGQWTSGTRYQAVYG